MTTKVCTRCKEEKLLSEFGILSSSKDGRNTRCKVCNNAQMRERYWKDPEAARKRQREHMRANPKMHKEIKARRAVKVEMQRKVFISALLRLQELGYTEVEGHSIKDWLEDMS